MSKGLASPCHVQFQQRYRGGNAKFADMPCYLDLFSLGGNDLGPEGGAAIAEALKVNKTITNIDTNQTNKHAHKSTIRSLGKVKRF